MLNNRFKYLVYSFTFIVFIFYFFALIGWVPPHGYIVKPLGSFDRYASMSYVHLLGTDRLGNDTFTLIVYGLKTAILSGLITMLPFLFTGVVLGLSAGYGEGRISEIANRIIETLNMVPKLLFLLIVISFMPINTYFILGLFGVLTSPKLAELLKRKVLTLKAEEFFESAIALGVSRRRILFVHVLWFNSKELLFSQMIYIFNLGVMMETSLSYMELGFGESVISWGWMIYKAIGSFNLLQIMAPVSALTIFTYSLYFISNVLNNKIEQLTD